MSLFYVYVLSLCTFVNNNHIVFCPATED